MDTCIQSRRWLAGPTAVPTRGCPYPRSPTWPPGWAGGARCSHCSLPLLCMDSIRIWGRAALAHCSALQFLPGPFFQGVGVSFYVGRVWPGREEGNRSNGPRSGFLVTPVLRGLVVVRKKKKKTRQAKLLSDSKADRHIRLAFSKKPAMQIVTLQTIWSFGSGRFGWSLGFAHFWTLPPVEPGPVIRCPASQRFYHFSNFLFLSTSREQGSFEVRAQRKGGTSLTRTHTHLQPPRPPPPSDWAHGWNFQLAALSKSPRLVKLTGSPKNFP